jgi:hypothetical protein
MNLLASSCLKITLTAVLGVWLAVQRRRHGWGDCQWTDGRVHWPQRGEKFGPFIPYVTVRVYLIGYIFYIIDYHICQNIFDRIEIMYYMLSYIFRGALSIKTSAPIYICTSIKQYNHLTFIDTPLSNMVIRVIDFFFASAHL